MSKIVIGIIENKNKFLMARRKFNEGNLSWTFPGGAIEENESEEQAIEREIFEETDVKAKVIRKLGERIHPTTKKEISYLLCNYVSGVIKVKDTEELDRVEWMTSSELFRAVTSDIFQPVKEYLQAK
jgi:8-oxo-dGTP diphosphatase